MWYDGGMTSLLFFVVVFIFEKKVLASTAMVTSSNANAFLIMYSRRSDTCWEHTTGERGLGCRNGLKFKPPPTVARQTFGGRFGLRGNLRDDNRMPPAWKKRDGYATPYYYYMHQPPINERLSSF